MSLWKIGTKRETLYCECCDQYMTSLEELHAHLSKPCNTVESFQKGDKDSLSKVKSERRKVA